MKIKTKETQVVQSGDIQNNGVSIDANNIDFIVSILSTNLYSKPIESLVRETVSNAWDSHTEAGVTEPVVLELGKDTEGNYFYSIEDFGVGLSAERFNEIYRMIGSSTKRATNNQIGGFGIGRFSVLAYSDVVNITSHYNGVKYEYLMYKDDGKISIDLLHEQTTEERNGVKVCVPIEDKYDLNEFCEALKSQLVYFENIYLINSTGKEDVKNFVDQFNNLSIKKYNNFWVNNFNLQGKQMNLVLGKVNYPLRFDNIDIPNKYDTKKYPISLTFDIGDLEVTPNREELVYSKESIAMIEAAIIRAVAEIKQLLKNRPTDFTDFHEYMRVSKGSYFKLLETDQGDVVIEDNVIQEEMTLNGIRYNPGNVRKFHDYILGHRFLSTYYKLRSGKFQRRNKLSLKLEEIMDDPEGYYFADIANLTVVSKAFLKEHALDGSCFFVNSEENWRKQTKYLLKKLRWNYSSGYSYKEAKLVLKYFGEYMAKLPKFNPNNIPESWKKARKEKLRLNRGKRSYSKEQITIHQLRPSRSGGDFTTDSITTTFEKLSKFQGLTIYAERGSIRLTSLYKTIGKQYQNYRFVEIAPSKLKKLDGISRCIKLKDFMATVNYKAIRRVATAMYIEEKIPFIHKLAKLKNLEKVSVKLKDVSKELSRYCKAYLKSYVDEEVTKEMYDLCKQHGYFDISMKGSLDANLKFLKQGEIILLFGQKIFSSYDRECSILPEKAINLVTDYVLARRLFIPDYDAYSKLQEETILNLETEQV